MNTVTSLISALVLTAALAGAGTERTFVPIFESHSELTPQGRIDELVFAGLKRLGIQAVNLCSDGVFVRREYLDVIGTLPTPQEASQFLMDRDANKRGAVSTVGRAGSPAGQVGDLPHDQNNLQ